MWCYCVVSGDDKLASGLLPLSTIVSNVQTVANRYHTQKKKHMFGVDLFSSFFANNNKAIHMNWINVFVHCNFRAVVSIWFSSSFYATYFHYLTPEVQKNSIWNFFRWKWFRFITKFYKLKYIHAYLYYLNTTEPSATLSVYYFITKIRG